MKLSEKIQEALREQQEINLSDPTVQKRLAAQWGYVPAGAQPAPSFADAYQGAMEEVAIWKKRALEAEDLNRKFVAEINGPTYMGGPAQPTPSVPEGVSFIDTSQLAGVVSTEIVHSYPPPSGWLRAIDEVLVVTHLGVTNAHDTYEQAKAKLDNLIGFFVDVATDPAVNGGYRLVPIELTHEKEPTMQDALMKFDPATGEERPYPSHATQWRNWHGIAAWLFDPWTGRRRNAYDVGSDVHGLLIAPAGTLGMDMGGGCATTAASIRASEHPSGPTSTGEIEMIDINKMRRLALDGDLAAMQEIILRLEAAESECLEQARLNGMGGEREAALMAKLEAAEKDIAIKEEVIDSLAAVVKRLDAQCDAAERERDECNRRRLEAADHFAAQTELMKKKYDDLRVKVAEMEQQEPVGVLHVGSYYGEELQDWEFEANQCACDKLNEAYVRNPMSLPLYALPGAQAQPAKNAVAYLDLGTGGYMDVGTDLTDEELATLPKGRHMLGIIGTYGVDGYVPAQPAPSVPMDVIVDYLVSISAHLARRDDAKAQAEIGELLKMIAAAPKPEAKS